VDVARLTADKRSELTTANAGDETITILPLMIEIKWPSRK
jgi:hypothetical protein